MDKRMEAQYIYRILRVLLDSPEFSDYLYHDSEFFYPPPTVNKLCSGPDNVTQEFILGTSELEEASYQEEEEIRTGLECVIAWMGDQLTVEQLRGLWKYRHEDFDSFDRMDYMIPVFGWFHLVMAFENSLHKQYLGTSVGIGGMQQAFDVLKRKGLVLQSTKGPFWHHLDEVIHHISEAHFRSSWLVVGGVKSMAELKKKSPQQLCSLATKLIRGGNPKYTIDILELLQGLHREWPDDVYKYICEWCWVMNQAGKDNSWLAFDLGQEENIADIKVNYHSMGPGVKMAYMHKISPAIPTLRAVQRHVEKQFKTVSRGAQHGAPDKERDVRTIATQYTDSELHLQIAGRKIKLVQII
ncbi:hypothetical protein L208DRAFT_1457964 [Tricholoma matsutake]|nr:hypothetical protein L208DRAFT_1457964 [Tricholoma matsutake 945]